MIFFYPGALLSKMVRWVIYTILCVVCCRATVDARNTTELDQFLSKGGYKVHDSVQLVNYPNVIKLFNRVAPVIKEQFTFRPE